MELRVFLSLVVTLDFAVVVFFLAMRFVITVNVQVWPALSLRERAG
jgi:hypothetical protein